MATAVVRTKAALEAIKDGAMTNADILVLTEAYILLRQHIRMTTRPVIVNRKMEALTATARVEAEAEANINLGSDE